MDHFLNIRPLYVAIAAMVCLCAVVGCGEELQVRDVKRIEEKVSPAEFESYKSIINSLPEQVVPALPSTLLPRPHWTQERTLPIQDLVRQENDNFEERWSVEDLTRQMPKSRELLRALRRERMTPEQFVGLTLTIGAALSADAVDAKIDLAEVIEKGQKQVKELEADQTAFSSLSDELAHEVLSRAAWITVVNRARVLLKVPPENLLLVREHREWLDKVFPGDLKGDPLAELTNVMQDRGIPFDELPESGSDEQIRWDAKEALVGEISPRQER